MHHTWQRNWENITWHLWCSLHTNWLLHIDGYLQVTLQKFDFITLQTRDVGVRLDSFRYFFFSYSLFVCFPLHLLSKSKSGDFHFLNSHVIQLLTFLQFIHTTTANVLISSCLDQQDNVLPDILGLCLAPLPVHSRLPAFSQQMKGLERKAFIYYSEYSSSWHLKMFNFTSTKLTYFLRRLEIIS